MNKLLFFMIIVFIFITSFYVFREYTDNLRQQNIRHILTETCKIFNKYNLEYWVDYGSLLGIHRNKDIIKGDLDADISIVGEDPKLMDEISKAFPNHMIMVREKGWNAYRIWYKVMKRYNITHGYVDVYINEPSGDKYISPLNNEKDNIAINLIQPIKQIKWNNILVNIPNKHKEVLIYRYGSDYMTPKRGFKG
jgi:phosphorylcholine metabolism protein LicD